MIDPEEQELIEARDEAYRERDEADRKWGEAHLKWAKAKRKLREYRDSKAQQGEKAGV